MQPAARLEVRSASGNLLFTVTISETETAPAQSGQVKLSGNNGQGKPHNGLQLLPQKEDAKPDPHPKHTPTNGEALMTDSQKRLLFRLLADQGIEGEKAHEHLKKQFQVNTLKEVTKLEASRGIEKLLSDAKGGRPFHAAA
ncbi:MAG: hypothetical protein HY033_10300 [Ignavibacteriae bacterium]|nr:hypothetical protein [Ignavibacteria bacterium]MBI3365287.1 hypothetical protein [Ignavibacteriota bacterium]